MAEGSNWQWVRKDKTLDTDSVIQIWVNIHTGNWVRGKTSGFASNHIHLYFADGSDSGWNLDPVTGQASPDGNLWYDVLSIAVIIAASSTAGAFGGGAAIADSAKTIFDPNNPKVPAGLVFPPPA